MSGLGRRSHYRKHLTDTVLFDLVEPNKEEGDCIAKIVGTRGGNQFDIVLPTEHTGCNTDGVVHKANDDREIHLAILPSKFRKLVWVKRGDFVIVSCAQNEANNTNDGEIGTGITRDSVIPSGVRYIVSHILYPDQIKNLRKKCMWPSDPSFSLPSNHLGRPIRLDELKNEPTESVLTVRQNVYGCGTPDDLSSDEYDHAKDNEEDVYDDGIVYVGHEVDDEYFVNYNRVAKLNILDSSSDEEHKEFNPKLKENLNIKMKNSI